MLNHSLQLLIASEFLRLSCALSWIGNPPLSARFHRGARGNRVPRMVKVIYTTRREGRAYFSGPGAREAEKEGQELQGLARR